MNRLQMAVEKQRAQIKKLDQAALDFRTENEELRSVNDRMTSCNRDLRRKCRAAQTQMHEMIDERAELTAKVSSTTYYKFKKKKYWVNMTVSPHLHSCMTVTGRSRSW